MSFSKTLKNAQNISTLSLKSTSPVTYEEPAVMSLSLEDELIAAYSGDDGNWESHPNYKQYFYYDENKTKQFAFSDDNISNITNEKEIQLDSKQINITQEENSQYIPFEMARYYDGYDLTVANISIHYITSNGEHGASIPVNVTYNDEKIRFGWLVDAYATNFAGKLKFEIHADGMIVDDEDNKRAYTWKTKPNEDLKVLESLCGTNCNDVINVSDSWVQELISAVAENVANQIAGAEVDAKVKTAQDAADKAEESAKAAEQYKNDASSVALETVNAALVNYTTKQYVDETIDGVRKTLENYYTKEEVDKLFEDFDISDQLVDITDRVSTLETEFKNFDGLAALDIQYDGVNTLSFYNGEELIKEIVLNTNPSSEWVTAYDSKVDTKISNAVSPVQEELTAYKIQTDADLQSIHNNIDNLPATLESDYYNKTQTDELLNAKANQTALNDLSATVTSVQSTANTNKTDISTLGTKVAELSDAIENVDTSPSLIYDIKYEEDKLTLLEGSSEDTLAAKTTVTITGGSGGASTSSSLKIEYVTKTPLVVTVDDKALITFKFSGTDSSGDAVLEGQATWKVAGSVVATSVVVDGENTFDITDFITLGSQKVVLSVTDEAGSLVTKTWTVQKIDVRLESSFNDKFTYPVGDISFDYTPYGAISKDVHFVLDGKEIGKVTTSSSGIPMGYTLPSQEHGSHLLEVYMTAVVNNNTIESNHIYKDILWYDGSSPVIGCVQQNIKALQYDTTNIVYTVYDPKTESPEVVLAVDGNVVSTLTLDSNTQTWQFKSSEVGAHVLTITCGETVKIINVTVEKLDINVEPVTTGLVIDFNPVGKSNSDADRVWSNDTYAMTVSDNFDWVNGGYQIDANGDQYFCIKAGTNVELNYQMFADDAKRNGKEMKLVFRTTNVQEADAQFMSCIDNTTGTDHVGVEMFVHEAFIYGSADKLNLKYSENDIIEFEFNITKNTEAVTEICGYEDGVSTRHLIYDDSFNFTQSTPKVITLGSDKCDLHIYRLKIYNTSLTDRGILSNFIADARNAEEMIRRYNRNQIYDENQQLTPEILAEKCPWLRVYVVSAPYFTNKKSDKVPYTTIKQIYKNGDPVLDNWTCYDCSHSGQGTSSDNYGASARNLDFIMNKSQREGVKPYFILGDGKTRAEEVSLTRTSVPNAYFNFKANVASNNHFTNALLAKRYNTFNPYILPYVREDESIIEYIKTTMEFHNAVVFIQETDTDLSTHREFADNLVHFYSIGNIGDSKKTDDTRLVDPTDRYEFINEICDVELPLSDWPNTPEAFAALEAEKFDKSGSYEWRYIWEDGTDEENAEVFDFCKQKWIDMYRFVVESSDEDFKAHLGDYFVLDSVLYYYLFTTRYCMVDNRAKNSFWHYGKTGEVDESGNPIRKFDLAMAYDCDSSMSLNNYGNSVYRHGYEDTDVLDGTTEEVFRESYSTFFCRVRDLFTDKLKEMYNTLESKNAWHSGSFLNEIETWQNEFPEELWRLDTQRKYIRSHNESFINGAGDPQYLKNMAQGKMKYTIKQWERSQEAYMASKYQSSVASSDNAVLRCTVPTGDLVVPVNYKLKLTPYDYMYLNVKYGTQEPIQVRANPGVQYEIPFEGNAADIVDIFSASRIQDLGDLSSTYPATVDTAKASRLKELHVGNDIDGYDNPSLTTMTLGANYLLEVLNIENVSGLTQALNLSDLNNLRELYAHGTNVGGVTFANGGAMQIAELPAVTSISMKNLAYLERLDIEDYSKLTTLTVENCNTVDVKEILRQASNVNRVRITGVDWTLEDTSLLDRIYNMTGLDKDGYNTDRSILAGKVHVPVIRQQQLHDYQTAWSDLEITFDTMIAQFAVTFKNDDGTVLEVQHVDKGEDAVDPATRTENPLIPTKESSVSHDFTFAGWDSVLTSVFSDRTIIATYTESLRTYTIKYVSKGTTLQETSGLYGTNIPYAGEIPTYTLEESAYAYYLFNRWDKSGFIDGDKTVEAIFDRCEYVDGYFNGKELSDLSPVEIYALTKLGLEASVITDKDPYSFTLGYDVDYDDIESEVIISEKTSFTGTNHIDTGIQLFKEDRDFVLAIDYEFLNGNINGSVLAQCYQSNGSNGFKLWYNSGTKFTWGTTSESVDAVNNREMIVIRHQKGNNNLIIYNSNLDEVNVSTVELTRTKSTVIDSTLVFGSAKADDGAFENYAVGDIHWCKVWYADLGDETCKNLAIWTHENVTLEACGFKRYYLSDNPSKRCSFSLLATHLLERNRQFGLSTSNTGGWATSTLNAFLNNRLYKALPNQIKSLIKKVTVSSSIGNMSSETSSSECYIFVPSAIELDPTMTSEPYYSEGSAISYMLSDEKRKRAYDGGDYGEYWTRSPNVKHTTYVYKIDANGQLYGFNYPNSKLGVLIEISF